MRIHCSLALIALCFGCKVSKPIAAIEPKVTIKELMQAEDGRGNCYSFIYKIIESETDFRVEKLGTKTKPCRRLANVGHSGTQSKIAEGFKGSFF